MAFLFLHGFENLPTDVLPNSAITGTVALLQAQNFIVSLAKSNVATHSILSGSRTGGQYASGGLFYGGGTSPGLQNTTTVFALGIPVTQYNTLGHACVAGGGLSMGFAGRFTSTVAGSIQSSYGISAAAFGFHMNKVSGSQRVVSSDAMVVSIGSSVSNVNVIDRLMIWVGSALATPNINNVTVTLPQPIDGALWHYYEMALTPLSDTTFVMKIFVDGILCYTSPTLTWTTNASNAAPTTTYGIIAGVNYSEASSYNTYSTKSLDVDDWYISDHIGANSDEFYGELQITRRLPNTDVSTGWTRVGSASTNYGTVTTTDQIQRTNYLTTSTNNTLDLYSSNTTFNVGSTSKVRALMVDLTVAKNTTSDITMAIALSNGTTTVTSPNFVPGSGIGVALPNRQVIFDRNPITSAPFTMAEAISLQYGIKRTSA